MLGLLWTPENPGQYWCGAGIPRGWTGGVGGLEVWLARLLRRRGLRPRIMLIGGCELKVANVLVFVTPLFGNVSYSDVG